LRIRSLSPSVQDISVSNLLEPSLRFCFIHGFTYEMSPKWLGFLVISELYPLSPCGDTLMHNPYVSGGLDFAAL